MVAPPATAQATFAVGGVTRQLSEQRAKLGAGGVGQLVPQEP
jgi:hypothetical protein